MSAGKWLLIGLGLAGLTIWGLAQGEDKDGVFAEADSLYRHERARGRSRISARRVLQGYLGDDYHEWAKSRSAMLRSE